MPPLAEPLNQALEGAYGSYFFGFVVIEDGWASGVVYNTASREREEQEGARGQTMSKRPVLAYRMPRGAKRAG